MRYTTDIPKLDQPSAVALGLFDGLHRGHREVIRQAVACGPELFPTVFTFTFDDPDRITKPHFAAILSPERKRAILENLGVELVCEPPFSAFRDLEPEAFFAEMLRDRLNAHAVFCGPDFRFGRNARGDATLLGALCREAGIRFETVPALLEDDAPVSSTRIRELLREGDPEGAARLLGERYAIDFPVVHGRQLGRKMGYPTINQLYPAGSLLPRFGVYATLAAIDGKEWMGVTNVGVKPTIAGGDAPSAETYLLDYHGDLYGRRVTLSFVSFLRPERKFGSVEELFRQIAADADTAKARLTPLLG